MTEKSNLIDIWTAEARRIHKLPADWYAWKFAAITKMGKLTIGRLRVTGAVCPLITRGPRKGQPNVRRAGKRTTVIIDISKLDTSHVAKVI